MGRGVCDRKSVRRSTTSPSHCFAMGPTLSPAARRRGTLSKISEGDRGGEKNSFDSYACRLTEGAEPLPGGSSRHGALGGRALHRPSGSWRASSSSHSATAIPSAISRRRTRRKSALYCNASRSLCRPSPRRSRSMSVHGRMADGSRCTFISSSNRPEIAGARTMTVPDPPCRRRCSGRQCPARRRSRGGLPHTLKRLLAPAGRGWRGLIGASSASLIAAARW